MLTNAFVLKTGSFSFYFHFQKVVLLCPPPPPINDSINRQQLCFILPRLLFVIEYTLLVVMVNWLFNVTINDISVIYVTAHRCAGGLKKQSHTKMKSGLPMGIPCAAHGLPTEAVGSSVDRSCPLFM